MIAYVIVLIATLMSGEIEMGYIGQPLPGEALCNQLLDHPNVSNIIEYERKRFEGLGTPVDSIDKRCMPVEQYNAMVQQFLNDRKDR